jgi:hypothetical protein
MPQCIPNEHTLDSMVIRLGCCLGLDLDCAGFTPDMKTVCEIQVVTAPMDISCIFDVVAGYHNETIQQSAGLVGFLEQLAFNLVGTFVQAIMAQALFATTVILISANLFC